MKNITYDDLNVGDMFINNGIYICRKEKPIPPVVPIAFTTLGDASEDDKELFPSLDL